YLAALLQASEARHPIVLNKMQQGLLENLSLVECHYETDITAEWYVLHPLVQVVLQRQHLLPEHH
ncbi:MAG: hypothetical protein M3347_05740, partial [Armatimonadota bacterium]|nr:hypothetical protein [Armatimonadota bacterium]